MKHQIESQHSKTHVGGQIKSHIENLCALIKRSPRILLTTHRQCDGDGLGAQLAVYHALKAGGWAVHAINVDRTPRKYHFLNPDHYISYFEEVPQSLQALQDFDLTLVFDTNDEKVLPGLMPEIRRRCRHIAFIDHHPLIGSADDIGKYSIVDTLAASTGEIVWHILRALGLPIDLKIAEALYTSITFDTQLYRFVRNSPMSHIIAADLFQYGIQAENIHRFLFGNFTRNKMAYLAKSLQNIEYFFGNTFAFLEIYDGDMTTFGIQSDESRDIIDMIMNIESLKAAALLRIENSQSIKVSLRSHGQVELLPLALDLGGGGHRHSCGAWFKGSPIELKKKILGHFRSILDIQPSHLLKPSPQSESNL